MGYKHKLKKDLKTRQFFKKSEMKNIILKYYINTDIYIEYKKYFFFKFLKNFHLNSSSSRIVNRCVITGRAGGIVRKVRFSRMTFREFADMGKICGIKKVT